MVEIAFVASAAAATGAAIALGANGVADVGDMLGFIGAFVGAVLTVGGAIYIADRNGKKQEKEALGFIYETVVGIDASCSFLQRLKGGNTDDADGSAAEMAGRLRHEILSIPAIGNMLDQPVLLAQIKKPNLLWHVMELRECLRDARSPFKAANRQRYRTISGVHGDEFLDLELEDELLTELRLVAQNVGLAVERYLGYERRM